jgi:tetratricopeptide (TPR) repeat protein
MPNEMLAAARWFSLALLLIATPAIADTGASGDAAATPTATVDAKPGFVDGEQVGKWIEDLGSRRYVTRREAQQRLMEIGMKAFDQIDAAVNHPDPEIAATCRYLVSELTVRWTRRDDSPQVKLALEDYASSDDEKRLAVVQALASRSEPWAISPLCRICRYDASPQVSREAAIGLMRTTKYDLGYQPETPGILREAMGTSVRPAAGWVRLLALQMEDPHAAAAEWPAVIEQAAAEVAVATDETTATLQLADLLRNQARLALQTDDSEAFLAVVDQMSTTPGIAVVDELQRLLAWDRLAKDTKLVDLLLARHGGELGESKAGLYMIAQIRAEQGQTELAEELAEKAFAIKATPGGGGMPEDRLTLGQLLISEGQVEWGRRELRATIEEVPVGSELHSTAALLLATSLHDWQQDEEAAKVLGDLTKAIRADGELLKRYNMQAQNGVRINGIRRQLTPLDEIDSSQAYYEACHLQTTGDKESQWKALRRALKADDTNADIIIGMYRASEGDEAKRKEAMEIIAQRCRTLEQSISDYPSYPDVTNWYNEWAWLVGNTEGDFEKAVRYSQKSIDLFREHNVGNPSFSEEDTAGLLDTLGRCYFAAGDLDAAIETQELAVKYEPHLRVLQRQLDEFQAARAAKKS